MYNLLSSPMLPWRQDVAHGLHTVRLPFSSAMFFFRACGGIMLRVVNWTTFDRTDGRNSVIENWYEIAIAAPKLVTGFHTLGMYARGSGTQFSQ
jgi:hypothetical protein